MSNLAQLLQAPGMSLEADGDFDAVNALVMEKGWGDGLPVVPPTEARVAAMLEYCDRPWDQPIAKIPPRWGEATPLRLAANAVMAGCEPRAFPLLIAALQGIVEREFNALALMATTSSVIPMLIVNGPERDALRIDYQSGCLGGAAGRGSMTIGRAMSLCLRNIGGQRVGENSRSVFGQPARFGLCFGEWDERSPWPTLAERQLAALVEQQRRTHRLVQAVLLVALGFVLGMMLARAILAV